MRARFGSTGPAAASGPASIVFGGGGIARGRFAPALGPARRGVWRGGRDATSAALVFCAEADEGAKTLLSLAPEPIVFVFPMALGLLCGP